MFRSPKALPGRSLVELGSLVPSKLPQGSLEPRDSPPSKRGPPAWTWPGPLRGPLQSPLRQAPRLLAGRRPWCAEDGEAGRALPMLEPPLGGGSGEQHVQRMPEPGRRDLRSSNPPVSPPALPPNPLLQQAFGAHRRLHTRTCCHAGAVGGELGQRVSWTGLGGQGDGRRRDDSAPGNARIGAAGNACRPAVMLRTAFSPRKP